MPDSTATLGIRADAGAFMGVGHVMRCLALAQEWITRGGAVYLYTHADSPGILERLKKENIQIYKPENAPGSREEAQEIKGHATNARVSWMVVDGYHFSIEYLSELKESRTRLLVIDDLADNKNVPADIVLNPNAYAIPSMYPQCDHVLAGAKYTLLRREFIDSRRMRAPEPAVARKVLVTMGGGDIHNVTLKVITMLAEGGIPGLKFEVVLGSANPQEAEMRRLFSGEKRISLHVNPANLPDLMRGADMAISASGSTCWEMLHIGVPLMVILTADNQKKVAAELAALGLAEVLGEHHELSSANFCRQFSEFISDKPRRHRMSVEGRNLIDGFGASRIVEAMSLHPLSVRTAREEDATLYWQWANDPEVRSSAFHSEYIEWKDHVKWFHKKLGDPECLMAVVLDASGEPLGQVRFEREAGRATLDFSISSGHRGKGFGAAVLRLATGLFFEDSNSKRAEAWVKKTNFRSQRAFLKAGFKLFDEREMHREAAAGYSLGRDEFFEGKTLYCRWNPAMESESV
jgi:UDP-2,4-diacetamido-2,4,6-trideoxy-beta-L-altropyranose hydrolase